MSLIYNNEDILGSSEHSNENLGLSTVSITPQLGGTITTGSYVNYPTNLVDTTINYQEYLTGFVSTNNYNNTSITGTTISYSYGSEGQTNFYVKALLTTENQTKFLCLAMLEIDPLCGKYFTYEVNENLKKLLTSENPNEYNLGINLWKNNLK